MHDIDIRKIIEAAEAGGKVIKSYFGTVLEAQQKSIAADVRTKADVESEQAILQILESVFPDYTIYSEETGMRDKGSEYTFYVDPLDGTNNFVLGIPHFSVGIALLKGEKTIAGVIHNPITLQTYSAELGKGSFLNGERIQVNKEADLERVTIGVSCSYKTTPKQKAIISSCLYELHPKRILPLWSPLLDFTLLASGKTEALTCTIDDALYDYLAGKIIVEEAGGKITGFKGEKISDKTPIFVASNGTPVHEKVLAAAQKYEL